MKLLDFGAIVSVLPGRDGLLHISQIANERVNAVADYLKEGQAVRVKVIEADEKGRLRLSMKAAAAEAQEPDSYLATCFSRNSSSVLQSMHSVAVGRASSRLRPISTPQLSQ